MMRLTLGSPLIASASSAASRVVTVKLRLLRRMLPADQRWKAVEGCWSAGTAAQ